MDIPKAQSCIAGQGAERTPIALSDIQQRVLANGELFYLRVPSCGVTGYLPEMLAAQDGADVGALLLDDGALLQGRLGLAHLGDQRAARTENFRIFRGIFWPQLDINRGFRGASYEQSSTAPTGFFYLTSKKQCYLRVSSCRALVAFSWHSLWGCVVRLRAVFYNPGGFVPSDIQQIVLKTLILLSRGT